MFRLLIVTSLFTISLYFWHAQSLCNSQSNEWCLYISEKLDHLVISWVSKNSAISYGLHQHSLKFRLFKIKQSNQTGIKISKFHQVITYYLKYKNHALLFFIRMIQIEQALITLSFEFIYSQLTILMIFLVLLRSQLCGI